jgi:beta-glucosidase
MYFKGKPLYPFGYGLSYTTFKYSGLKTSSASVAKDGDLTVSVKVENSGDRAGEEVVQLYVRHPKSTVPRPLKELRGFRRIALGPGEAEVVEFRLEPRSLAYWDVARHAFEVETGPVEIGIGGSSADLPLKSTVMVK